MKKFFFRFVIFILVIIVLRIFVVDVKVAVGHSMEPVISEGDVLVIWKLAYGLKNPINNSYFIKWCKPSVNDVVLFALDDMFIIKTCVAESGDKLKFDVIDGKYFVEFRKQQIMLDYEKYRTLGGTGNIEYVPDDMIVVLGENLSVSYDSRNFGFLSVDSIYGKVIWI